MRVRFAIGPGPDDGGSRPKVMRAHVPERSGTVWVCADAASAQSEDAISVNVLAKRIGLRRAMTGSMGSRLTIAQGPLPAKVCAPVARRSQPPIVREKTQPQQGHRCTLRLQRVDRELVHSAPRATRAGSKARELFCRLRIGTFGLSAQNPQVARAISDAIEFGV